MACSTGFSVPRICWFAAASLLLSACSGGGSGSNDSGGAPPVPTVVRKGSVTGGQQPVSGSTVTIYAVGSGGYGVGATALGTTTTDAKGDWTITVVCPSGNPQTYAVAEGGNAGFGGVNSALGMMVALGPCDASSGLADVNLNEVTTIAGVYALAQFLDSGATQVGTSATNSVGLDNAVALAARLANVETGVVPTAPAGINVPASAVNTLADIIGSCVNSTGGVAGESNACGQLFSAATPPGGAAPVTTLQAALDIALHPANNAAALYDLMPPNPVFAPTLGAAPSDWMLGLTYTGGGLGEPSAVAIDAAGNAWVANFNGVVVSKFLADGSAATASGFSGGGLKESLGIAIDGSGNAWVVNQESASAVNSGQGSVTKLAADGTILSGANGYTGGGINFPESLAITPAGEVWIGNFGHGSVTRLNSAGGALSPAAGYSGGGLAFPIGVGIDGNGNVWVSDQGNNSVTQLGPSGAALSPSAGYTASGLGEPGGICPDGAGNIWVTSFLGDSLLRFAGSSAATPGAVLSPQAGYTGGLQRPYGCAVDGAGNVWVTNYRGASVSQFAGAGSASVGAVLSGAAGYASGRLSEPYGVAVDASGNVWVTNFSGDSLTVLVGAAAPVKTPLLGPPGLP